MIQFSSQIFCFIIAISSMDTKLRNPIKNNRVFGRDITNLDRRAKANSISEKNTQIIENRQKSRSFQKKIFQELRDPICDHQAQILAFMLSIQKKEKREIMININPDMRQILVDWLIDVHHSFELKDQTLYLALAYLNQYSSIVDITKHDYQLVGIACLWIASKFQEIYPPRMQNYIQVTDSSYTTSQLKSMEGKILLALNFNLNYTTPISILETVSDKWSKDFNGKLSKQSQRSLAMAKYIIELSMFEGLAKEYCLKTIVLSAIMLSDSVLKVKSDTKILDNQKIEKQTLMKCFKDMCLALQNISRPSSKLRAIKKKYGDEKYLCVSRFRIEQK